MSEPPDPPRGSRNYLPPPPDDSPESVHVPRNQPPPPSLEAMVRGRPGAPLKAQRMPLWPWVGLLIIAIGAGAYYLGLSH